jgi:hypothetical protein
MQIQHSQTKNIGVLCAALSTPIIDLDPLHIRSYIISSEIQNIQSNPIILINSRASAGAGAREVHSIPKFGTQRHEHISKYPTRASLHFFLS